MMSLSYSIIFNGEIMAHSPSALQLSYDISENVLDVTITHTVSNAQTHYIQRIEIEKEGSLQKLLKTYDSQPSTSTFTYSYTIAAEDGDVLTATVYCSQGDMLTKSITIEDDHAQSDGNNIFGFEIMLFVSAVAMILVLKKTKK
jgi:hypothetical protein